MRRVSTASLVLATLLALSSLGHAKGATSSGFSAGRYHSYGKGRLSATQAKHAVAIAVAKAEGIPDQNGQLRRIQNVQLSNKLSASGKVLFKAEVAVPADSPLALLAAKFGKPAPTKVVYGELDIAIKKPDRAATEALANQLWQNRRNANAESDWAYATRKLSATGHKPSEATVRRTASKEYKWRSNANALSDMVRAEQILRLDLDSGSRATIYGSSPTRFQQEVKALSK